MEESKSLFRILLCLVFFSVLLPSIWANAQNSQDSALFASYLQKGDYVGAFKVLAEEINADTRRGDVDTSLFYVAYDIMDSFTLSTTDWRLFKNPNAVIPRPSEIVTPRLTYSQSKAILSSWEEVLSTLEKSWGQDFLGFLKLVVLNQRTVMFNQFYNQTGEYPEVRPSDWLSLKDEISFRRLLLSILFQEADDFGTELNKLSSYSYYPFYMDDSLYFVLDNISDTFAANGGFDLALQVQEIALAELSDNDDLAKMIHQKIATLKALKEQ